MIFKKAETQSERVRLKTISKEDFESIGYKFDDYELDHDSFKQHEKEVKEYLGANK